jgi:EmrB/QacA subfamily drug resistance transporter
VNRGQRRWSAAVVATVAFLTTMDGTIVNVALPSIQRDLKMSLPAVQWVVTGYLITFSALMLAGGRLTDRYGRRLLLELGLGIFTAASLLAGLAGSAAVLLLARAAQGAGAALALPAGLALAASGPTARDRDAIAAMWMASLASALALGPVLGGWISQHLRWNWIFLVNLPAGLAGALIARYAVEDSPHDETAHADWGGLACSVTALAAATFVLTEGGQAGWMSGRIVLAAAVSAVATAGFLRRDRRSGAPVIDPAMLRNRAFGGGVAASVMWGAGVNGVFFFTSLFLQRYAGLDATRTGLVFVPVALLVVVVTPVTPKLADWLGAGPTVAGGLAVVAAGLMLLDVTVASAGSRVSQAALLVPAAVIGAGSALTVPLTTSVLESVPTDRAGIAGSVLSLAREASGLAGICVIGLVVTSAGGGVTSAGGGVTSADVVPAGSSFAGGGPALAGRAFASGYERGLLGAAVLMAAAAVIAWRTLPRRPGAAASRAEGRP